jgi:hypothetical protein
MIVTCVINTVQDLPPNPLAYNQSAVTHLTVNAEYGVCAMSIYAGALMAFLSDDTGLPNWYPIQLFRVDDSRIPDGWRFASYNESDHLQALWGYDELIEDEQHYDAVLARDPEALETFFSRSGRKAR